MVYADQQNLVQRYGSEIIAELAPPLDDKTGYDGVRVNVALWDARHTIDEILRNVNESLMGVLQAANCVIARYLLYKYEAPEKVTEEYNNMISQLKAAQNEDLSGWGLAGPKPEPAFNMEGF